MEFFLVVFLGGIFYGTLLSSEVFMILMTLLSLVVLYVYYLGIRSLFKWISFERVRSRRELRFNKAKWDAIESHGNKRLKRFGAYVGWEGIRAEYEYDNREDP
tara:strand:+ start:1526 stop:1834 length:309 start_codon:yes stop_codon:yes gene_type:complete